MRTVPGCHFPTTPQAKQAVQPFTVRLGELTQKDYIARMKWTQEAEDEILKRIAKGQAVTKICDDEWLPSEWAVYNRKNNDETFAKRYAQAREDQGDYEFDHAKAIVDNATPENVSVARLQFDAYKWRAGKLRPKVYGDKIDHNHGGSFTVNINGNDADL